MAGDATSPGGAQRARDYRALRPETRLEETIASVDPGPVPDPEARRLINCRVRRPVTGDSRRR